MECGSLLPLSSAEIIFYVDERQEAYYFTVMQTKQDIMTLLRDRLPELHREFGVKTLGIFGSFARDEASGNSDLDLLVEFERPIGLRFVEFTERLEKIVSRSVDVLTKAGVESIRQPEIAQTIKNSVVYV
jgi:predicted nucleotidyltransferase